MGRVIVGRVNGYRLICPGSNLLQILYEYIMGNYPAVELGC